MTALGSDSDVVGFKSIACYRTGLDIETTDDPASILRSLVEISSIYNAKGSIRLAHKAFNDYVVRLLLQIASVVRKPGAFHLPFNNHQLQPADSPPFFRCLVQFHTGLGDSDITLRLSSPSCLQPVIKLYPNTLFVLLHSSYPFTREAGYLTAVYPNVYLDFGEVFPFVSGEGQRSIIQQVLELCPTNKILWSSECSHLLTLPMAC